MYPPSYYYLYLPSSLTVENENDRYKGIRVATTNPSQSITVSGMNYEEGTADAFLALPSGPVLQEYTYITNSMLWTNRTGINFPSLILLVGTEDNTAVTITPTEYVTIPYDLRDINNQQAIIHPGQSYTVTLNRLETYQIESSQDLTGIQVLTFTTNYTNITINDLVPFYNYTCTVSAETVGDGPSSDEISFILPEGCEQINIENTLTMFFAYYLTAPDGALRMSLEWP